MKFLIGLITLAARFAIAALFIGASINKFLMFDETSQYMASKGLTMIPLLLVGAAAIEFIGGALLIVGFRTRIAAALLLLFLIPTTYIFHDFWNETGLEAHLQQIMFFKNVAIFGGLLYVLCFGAGVIAMDSCCRRQRPPEVMPPPAAPETKL